MIEQTKEQLAQRVIKFRAWHTGLNKMFSPEEMANDQLTLLPTGQFINVSGNRTSDSVIYSKDMMIPMQFTGKTFPDGVEIYEGDLIGMGKYVYVVKFEDAKFVLYHILNDYGKWGDLCRIFDVDFKDYSFTLIGNIFQNDLTVRK